MGLEASRDPSRVLGVGHAEDARRRRRHDEGLAVKAPSFDRRALARFHHLGRKLAERRLARLQHERIEEDEAAYAVGPRVGNAADHGVAERVADEHQVAQVLHVDGRDHVLDEGLKPDIRRDKVGAVAEAGQRRREYAMAGRLQALGDFSPAPAAMPGTVHQHIGLSLFRPLAPRPPIRGSASRRAHRMKRLSHRSSSSPRSWEQTGFVLPGQNSIGGGRRRLWAVFIEEPVGRAQGWGRA